MQSILNLFRKKNKINAPNSSTDIRIFGDFAQLDQRIGGVDDFKEKIAEINQRVAKGQNLKIIVCVSRYNFSRLNEICEFCLNLLNKTKKLDFIKLKLFPVKDLPVNVKNYFDEINKNIGTDIIQLEFGDKQLDEILKIISMHAQMDPGKERELLRLLGVVTEQVFIGPQTIVFDPFHRCNAKCQHCWVHTPGITQPEEFLSRKLDFDVFKSIIDDAAQMLVDGIILQGDGEPLMYDKFMPMLRYAKAKNLGVLFFTNGILLGKDKAQEVIDLGVNEIYCSLPAGSAQTYTKIVTIQPPETFQQVRNNLKQFIRLRQASGKNHPRLIISHVIHTMNYHELIEMAKMDVDIAPDAVRFYLIRLDVMNRHLQLKPDEVEAMRKMVPEIARILSEAKIEFVDNFGFQLEHYDNKTGAWSKDFFLNKGCTIGWYFNLIPAKYDMSFCCHLRTVGYLDKQSFKDIWNSAEYWQWRRQAKNLRRNKDAKFLNNQVIYDEHCDHCDNHQTIIRNLNDLKLYGLEKYY